MSTSGTGAILNRYINLLGMLDGTGKPAIKSALSAHFGVTSRRVEAPGINLNLND